MNGTQPHWKVDIAYSNRAEFAKYERQHPQEFDACFANLERMRQMLNRGLKLRTFQLGFLRNESGELYRIGQSGVAHAAETRLYIYPCESRGVIYVLGIRGKARQSDDISEFLKKIKTIKEQQ